MEFDLFTFIAQILNFLVLVFLLYKFLFGRVKSAMDEREKRIRENIEYAERKKAEADALEKENRELNQKLITEKEEMLIQARLEASGLREKLINESRSLASRESEKLELLLETQRERFYGALKIKSRDYVFALAEKMLRDLADEGLERKIIDKFIERIKKLDIEKVTQYKEIIHKSKNTLLIRSSFEIPKDTQNKINNVLKEKFQFEGVLNFEMNKKLCGIELELEFNKISWNIEEYIAEIEEKLFPLFSSKVSISEGL